MRGMMIRSVAVEKQIFVRANAPLEDPLSEVSKYALRARRGALWHWVRPVTLSVGASGRPGVRLSS
jgi:hypothetical protein